MKSVVHLGILACSVLLAAGSYAQDSGADRFGIGVKGSLLGGGVEAAARVTYHSNVRAGFNMFSYSRGFTKDGVSYNGQLSFKTVEAHYDIFPWARAFHISPGVLVYAATPITATASVPGGTNFSLNNTPYVSSTVVPVTGTPSPSILSVALGEPWNATPSSTGTLRCFEAFRGTRDRAGNWCDMARQGFCIARAILASWPKRSQCWKRVQSWLQEWAVPAGSLFASGTHEKSIMPSC